MKYALLIGITYEGTKLQLKGTQNDILSIKNILNSWGFHDQNITTISEYTNIKPTSFNINNTFSDFCRKLKSNDKAVIYYSGHGMRVKGDSCIVPLDHKKAGIINSESVRYYLNKIVKNVNVFCFFDCCNSGTICDLKYHHFDTSYKHDITLKHKFYNPEQWNLRQYKTVTEITKNLHVSINPEFEFTTKNVNDTSESFETKADIISLSSCWNDEQSYDLGKNGALTMSFLNTLNRYGLTVSFKDILRHTRGFIFNMRLNQTPQLTCGKDLDVEISLKDFLSI